MSASDLTPDKPGPSGSPPRSASGEHRWGPPRFFYIALVAVLALVGVFTYLAVRHNGEQGSIAGIQASGLPAVVPTSLANLMGLSPVPARPAPNFQLTDQDGHSLSLADFSGHAVVLEFMDSHCVDICPIVSQEFVDAYRDLGAEASRVVFVAVNVNPYHTAVADVAAFSHDHSLDTIPSWHFFTGSASQLQPVWQAYGVLVQASGPHKDVVHSSIVYFIDSRGRERFLASPSDEHTPAGVAYVPAGTLDSWGRGIALVTTQLVR